MSVSRQEEIISALWAIAALVAFGNGFTTWGWVFAVKAALDTTTAIVVGTKEAIAEVKAKRAHNEPNSPAAKQSGGARG